MTEISTVERIPFHLVTPSSIISPLGTRENPIHCEGRGSQMKGAASTRLTSARRLGCPQCPPQPGLFWRPWRRGGRGGWTGWGALQPPLSSHQ